MNAEGGREKASVAPTATDRRKVAVDCGDPQIVAGLEDYLRAFERGEPISREALLAKYADVADVLGKCLDGLDLVRLITPEGDVAAADAAGPSPTPAGPPKTLGDYRILREIGRGGMGVVYEAEQLSLHRRVALKMLPLAGILDHRQLQRFKTEAQAAAMLHQDHIVPVFGIGCERGVHYYAMQYIEGQTLAQLIRELRRQEGLDAPAASAPGRAELGGAEPTASLAPRGSRGLSPESSLAAEATTGDRPQPPAAAPSAETQPNSGAAIVTQRSTDRPAYFRSVAELGAHVADALEHAHQEGVIHRDIKPSNLILDQRGKVWVTDFGLARIASDPGISMTGDIVGTLRYMSPEQALAKRVLVDHRTDIYSLCATLYELLTLEPVFRGHDRQEVIKRIAFEEPRGLRKLNKAIPAELETIVLKGLEKNPDRRYATAREVAEDLRRFLQDTPIRARPPTLAQRAAKWSRRNKPLVASAAVILLLGVLALAVSNVLIARERNAAAAAAETAQRERDEAKTQRAKADQQRQVAEENFRRARQAVDTYLTKISEEQLLNAPGMQRLREDLLRLALEYYQGFIEQRSDDPTVLAELASAHARVGEITMKIGTTQEARKAYEESLKLRKQLVGRHPDNPRYRSDLAQSYLYLGSLDVETYQVEQASASIQQAIRIWRELVSDHPKAPEYQKDLVTALRLLGGVQMRVGEENKDAFQSLDEAIAIGERLKRLQEKHPDAHKYLSIVGSNYDAKAGLMFYMRDYSEALAGNEKARGIREQLVKENPSNLEYQSNLSTTYNNMAIAQITLGDVDGALESYKKAMELREKLAAQNPLVLDYQCDLAILAFNIADLQRQKDPGNALATYGITIEKFRDLVKKDPSRVGNRGMLGNSLACRASLQAGTFQAYDEAIADQAELINIATQRVADQPSLSSAKERLAEAYGWRASMYAKVGKYVDAFADYAAAADIYAGLLAPVADRATRIDRLNWFFAYCEAAGRHAEAKKVWEENHEEVEVKVADDPLPGSAIVDYRLRIEAPGEYQLYLRWGGQDKASDSIYAAMLNDKDEVVDWYLFQAARSWDEIGDAAAGADADFATQSWDTFGLRRRLIKGEPTVLEQPAVFSVTAPGRYILRLVQREGGAAADALIFQHSHLAAPENEGPPESPRDAAGVFVASGGKVVIEAEHFSFADPSWLVVPGEKGRQARHKNFRGNGYLVAWAEGGLVGAREKYWGNELQRRRRELGEADPSTLLSMATLARHVWAQNRHAEAAELHDQLLDLRKDMDADELAATSYWNLDKQLADLRKDMDAEDSTTFETELNHLSWNVYQRRGWKGAEIYGRQGVERARKFDPVGAELMFHAAPFLLLSGHQDEYRRICRELLEKHAETDSAATATQVVRMCVLDPKFGESERLVSLCQRGAKGGNDWDGNLYALGMAYCRAGDYDRAHEWLQKALSNPLRTGGPAVVALQPPPGCRDPHIRLRTTGGPAVVALQLAITCHYAGRTEEAKSWLDKAEQLFELPDKPSIPARFETLIYHQEAKSLIQAPAAKPAPAATRP